MPITGPVLQDKLCMGMMRKFDLVHEHEFERMEGLGAWYAKQNAVSPANDPNKKHKSDVLGSVPRQLIRLSNVHARCISKVVTPGTRHSLVAAAEVEEMEGMRAKQVRISVVETKRAQVVADTGDSDGDNMDVDQHANVEWEREHMVIKKKLEISQVHQRSSMGRVSIGEGKLPLIPNQHESCSFVFWAFVSQH